MRYVYKTRGVCPQEIAVTLKGEIIENVEFSGGCDGNLKAISKVVSGMPVETATKLFSGITCGHKNTSCSDQMVHAIQAAYDNQNG